MVLLFLGWLLVFLLKKLELEESLCKQYKQAKERVLFSYICPMSKIYLKNKVKRGWFVDIIARLYFLLQIFIISWFKFNERCVSMYFGWFTFEIYCLKIIASCFFYIFIRCQYVSFNLKRETKDVVLIRSCEVPV